MEGLDQSGNISKILELRVFAKMVWQRQDFLDLYTIPPLGGHIMKGSALRFFRYPLTGLSSILPGKFVNDFLTQDTAMKRALSSVTVWSVFSCDLFHTLLLEPSPLGKGGVGLLRR